MIYRSSTESIQEPSDIADVKREYDNVLLAAVRMAEPDLVKRD
jgi:hypothetical protein